MKINFYILVVLILLISCKKETKNIPQNALSGLKLKVTGEYKIQLDSITTFYSNNLQYIEDENLLVTMSSGSSEINVYDFKKQSLKKKIKLQFEGPNSVGYNAIGFYYKNKDSIFVFSDAGSDKLTLINENGIVANKYVSNLEEKPSKTFILCDGFTPITFLNNKVYASGFIGWAPNPDKTFEPPVLEFDLENKTAQYIFNNPKKLNQGIWLGNALNHYEYNDDINNFILSPSISDSLFFYNKEKQFVKKVYAGSTLFNEDDFIPVTEDLNHEDPISIDSDFANKISVESPKYWGVRYDKYRKLYYRFGILNGDFKEAKRGNHPDAIIMVYDKDFNLISENLIKAKKYLFPMSFVGKEGLYIGSIEKYKEDDNYMTFEILNLDYNE